MRLKIYIYMQEEHVYYGYCGNGNVTLIIDGVPSPTSRQLHDVAHMLTCDDKTLSVASILPLEDNNHICVII